MTVSLPMGEKKILEDEQIQCVPQRKVRIYESTELWPSDVALIRDPLASGFEI